MTGSRFTRIRPTRQAPRRGSYEGVRSCPRLAIGETALFLLRHQGHLAQFPGDDHRLAGAPAGRGTVTLP
jgi:hypothetical protein